MIPMPALWLAAEPVDMRADIDTVLVRVDAAFGTVKPHRAYATAGRTAQRR